MDEIYDDKENENLYSMYIREIDGRPPIDDPLPGQPDNLFLICRKIIKGY